jgi:hypothetical protein
MLARNVAGIDTTINLFHISVKQSIILKNSYLLDSASTINVCNDRSRFTEYRDIKNESLLQAMEKVCSKTSPDLRNFCYDEVTDSILLALEITRKDVAEARTATTTWIH